MELCFTEWHAASFILGKTCIFFMLWGLTHVMIRLFAEKEGGGDCILQNVPWGQLKKGKMVSSSPVLSELWLCVADSSSLHILILHQHKASVRGLGSS